VIGCWQEDYFRSAFALPNRPLTFSSVAIANRSLTRNRWFAFGLPRLVDALQPNIVHLGFPMPVQRRRDGPPIVATIHDLYPFDYPENFGYPQVFLNQLFLRICLHNSDALACVSQTTSARLGHHFPHAAAHRPTAVIPNYVDFPACAASPTENFAVPCAPFLLSVAQHRKNKNLDLLVRAFHRLRSEGVLAPEFRLVLVGGSGPETHTLTALVDRLGLSAQVDFLDGLQDAHLTSFYRHCRLFVAPSSIEGFCLPLAEALYFDCPVVCSDIPTFREVGSERCTTFSLDGDATTNLVEAIARTLTSAPPASGAPFPFTRARTAASCLELYSKLSPAATGVRGGL